MDRSRGDGEPGVQHASDVWSFGVTVVEIYSNGERPYAGMNNAEVLLLVQSGKRHPQPLACDDAVYKLLLECWHHQPGSRPAFTELIGRLDGIRGCGSDRSLGAGGPQRLTLLDDGNYVAETQFPANPAHPLDTHRAIVTVVAGRTAHIVISCPAFASLTGLAPFNQDVHRLITIGLKGVVYGAFDRKGTSLGTDARGEDFIEGLAGAGSGGSGVYWSLADIPDETKAGKTEAELKAMVKQSVRKSDWFGRFLDTVKAHLVSRAQDAGIRRVVPIAILGGLITEAEQDELSNGRLLGAVMADLKQIGYGHVQVEPLEVLAYPDFLHKYASPEFHLEQLRQQQRYLEHKAKQVEQQCRELDSGTSISTELRDYYKVSLRAEARFAHGGVWRWHCQSAAR